MSNPGPTTDALRHTFSAYEDGPLALVLVRLLARGEPVRDVTLAAAAERPIDEIAAQLARWPNIERDADDAVIGFSGLALRPTPHSFTVEGQALHAWCAWDTLFLPSILGTTAHVRSTDAITDTFCCHVHFLAGADAAHTWHETHPTGHLLDLTTAFALGCRATDALRASSTAPECC